ERIGMVFPLGDGQGCIGAHTLQLRLRLCSLRAERETEIDMAKSSGRGGRIARKLLRARHCQQVIGLIRIRLGSMLTELVQSRLRVALLDRKVGDEHRHLRYEDAI